jgi:hypothetical protein
VGEGVARFRGIEGVELMSPTVAPLRTLPSLFSCMSLESRYQIEDLRRAALKFVPAAPRSVAEARAAARERLADRVKGARS